ncbi:MAG: hypothetical protein ACOCUH_04035 [Bacteriovoracia bacterium]
MTSTQQVLDSFYKIVERPIFAEYLYNGLFIASRSVASFLQSGRRTAGTINNMQRDLQLLVNKLCRQFNIPTIELTITANIEVINSNNNLIININEILDQPRYHKTPPCLYFDQYQNSNKLNWLLEDVLQGVMNYWLQRFPLPVEEKISLLQEEIMPELHHMSCSHQEFLNKDRLQKQLEEKIFKK